MDAFMTALTAPHRKTLAIVLLADQHDKDGQKDVAAALRKGNPDALAEAKVSLRAIETAIGLVNLKQFQPIVEHYIKDYENLRAMHRVGFHDEWKRKQKEGERLLALIKASSKKTARPSRTKTEAGA